MRRELATAVRRNADRTTARLAAVSGSRQVIATVASVTAGAASDGLALVAVTWRGDPITVSGYASGYTPVVGHRVVCDLIDSQLLIAFRIVGQP